MPLKIYLDDNVACRTLRSLLEKAGFHVVEPAEAGLLGRADREHLDYARKHGLVLLTKDPVDYLLLHGEDAEHAGIIVIYQDNDVRRDMGFKDIVSALKQIVRLRIPVTGNFIVLNQYRLPKRNF